MERKIKGKVKCPVLFSVVSRKDSCTPEMEENAAEQLTSILGVLK